MFYLETRKEDGKLNGIEIVKLKNKLGKYGNSDVLLAFLYEMNLVHL